nr:MAG: terminase [Bacteriophage sp.]UVX52844.1 MAG: Terminase [Bacteriophage sp.]
MGREVRIKPTRDQKRFYELNCKFPAFVAGFGTGKSEVMCNSALLDSMEGGSDSLIALYEPTYDLVRLILAPRMEEKLIDMGVRYRYNKSDNVIYTSSSQFGDFVLRTLDNPARIVGYESFRAKIDELDTLRMEHAEHAWNKIIARNRQLPSTYNPAETKLGEKPVNTVSVFTTPEGFRFVHDRWVVNKKPGYEMVQASTLGNWHLPPDYVQSLRDTYPAQLIEAYINGEFVNLTAGTVYYAYDRRKNSSRETIKPGETLYIGQDFNVGHMASTVYVQRGKVWHAVAELVDMFDTPDVVRAITERWKSKGHYIVMYPDASGKNRKSNNASTSDIAQLQQAGFEVRAKSTNPPVKDRVSAMNKALESGMVMINEQACPVTARCLEQQAYDKNGEPDKSGGVDHQNDGTTYPIAYEMPIRKPVINIPVTFAL